MTLVFVATKRQLIQTTEMGLECYCLLPVLLLNYLLWLNFHVLTPERGLFRRKMHVET
jgi:hypothetical protein